MANTATWVFLLLFYFTGVAVVMGSLSVSGILTDDIDISTNPVVNTGFTPIYQMTDTLVVGAAVCTANGSLNFEEPDTMFFTYDNASTDLSSECTDFCRDESSLFVGFALSCTGLCANLTDSQGVNHIGCAPEDDRWNFLTGIIGFFFFSVDLGLGSWNWLITAIFVILPLLMFSLLIYYSLRSGN